MKMQDKNVNLKKKKNNEIPPVLAGVSVFAICVFLVILFCMLAYFNVGGLGLDVINTLRKNEAIALDEQKAMEQEKKNIEELKLEVEKMQEDLAKREEELEKGWEEIAQEEAQLIKEKKKYEDLVNDLMPEFNNIQEVAEIYRAMDAAKVAELLEKQDNMALKVRIIKALDVSFASQVLSKMSPDKAAAILERIHDY
jgi:flagellar motility protein MotE (MotC chaperone)